MQNSGLDDIDNDIQFFDTEIPQLISYDSFVMNEFNTVSFLYKIQACVYFYIYI